MSSSCSNQPHPVAMDAGSYTEILKESRIQLALSEYKFGSYTTLAAAATACQVEYETLLDRFEKVPNLYGSVPDSLSAVHVMKASALALQAAQLIPSRLKLKTEAFEAIQAAQLIPSRPKLKTDALEAKPIITPSRSSSATSVTDNMYEQEIALLRNECQDLRHQREMEHVRRQLAEAQLEAAQNYIKIHKLESEILRRKLDTQSERRKRRRLLRHGRLLAAPEVKVERREQEAGQTQREAKQTSKKHPKEATMRAEVGNSKVFGRPLSSIKRKDDFKDLAAALMLDGSGTIAQLSGRIKAHIDANPSLASNTRFAGLFQNARHGRKRAAPPAAIDHPHPVASSSMPAAAFSFVPLIHE